MAEYLTPGVFIEDSPNPPVANSVSTSTGGFIGIAKRGEVGKPTLITSWNAFINKFALGLDSPFLSNSDLAYAVYGFFQNGGKECYVLRVSAKEKAKKATYTAENSFSLEAKDEGDWANKLKFAVTANADEPTNFDLTLKLGENKVEVFTNLSNSTEDKNYWIDELEASEYICGVSGNLAVVTDGVFVGGEDGLTGIADADYTDALSEFDLIEDINLLCIPGQTSSTLQTALMQYCEKRTDVFAILDCPEASTTDSILALRKTYACKNAALFYPWIKVTDPLSKNGKLRSCPPCGHIMGVYARTITKRGVWKAPAGTEAIVRGAVEVTETLTTADTDKLNPAGIISILPKTNYGIVIWGARSLHPDSSMKYVSDILLDIYIKKMVYQLTQPFVFEPNDPQTWTRVTTAIQTFLDGLWREGALHGTSAAEAYSVKCDAELNNSVVRSSGKLICEVGYANKSHAEFVIFRLSRGLANN